MIAPSRRAFLRPLTILAAPLVLAACISPGPAGDPQTVIAADTLRAEAASFYRALAATSAPQCSYEQNKNHYDDMTALTKALAERITVSGTSPIQVRAGVLLTRLIEDARAAHIAASARSDDPHGPCMAPGAIALNAAAIDRAGAAIAQAQAGEGDQ